MSLWDRSEEDSFETSFFGRQFYTVLNTIFFCQFPMKKRDFFRTKALLSTEYLHFSHSWYSLRVKNGSSLRSKPDPYKTVMQNCLVFRISPLLCLLSVLFAK